MRIDNRTLTLVLNLVFFITALFSLLAVRVRASRGYIYWTLGNFLLLFGFLLLMLQSYLNVHITILAANFMIALGGLYQTKAAIRLNNPAKDMPNLLLIIVVLAFIGAFVPLIYIKFNTALRVIVISAVLAGTSGYAAIVLIRDLRERRRRLQSQYGLIIIFIVNLLFYLFRGVYTGLYDRKLISIFSQDLMSSGAFIHFIFFQLSFTLLIFSLSLQLTAEQLSNEKNRIDDLFRFLNETARQLTLTELYGKICDIMIRFFQIDMLGIYMREEDLSGHTLVYSHGLPEEHREKLSRLARGEGITGRTIETGELKFFDIEEYPENRFIGLLRELKLEFIAAIPFSDADRVLGAMLVGFVNRRSNIKLDKAMMTALSDQIGLVLGNALLYEQVTKMAFTDHLTGLSNRRQILSLAHTEAMRFLRNGSPFCLAMFDIDRFKTLNDTYGHDCGDQVLKTLSGHLLMVSRGSDMLARWGGEEFIIILTGVRLEQARIIGERIRESVENLRVGCGKDFTTLTISMGIAEFWRDETLEECISRCDEKLYEAKHSGRNRVCV